MIFPGYVSQDSFKPSFKLSWIILILNLVIYFGIAFAFNAWPNAEVRKKIVEEKFKRSVFEMYVQTLDPIEKSQLFGPLDTVYSRALKDEKFWARLNTFPFRGDKVQIEEVKTVLGVFHKTYKESAQFQYGLGSFEVSPWSWLTYQFVHASLLHLFGNMLIVFLVLSFLEKFISIGWLVCVYIFSGFAGGVAFLNFDDVGSMSVVGASASASGILAFLLILKNRELMPWFFMLAPIKNGWGKIYLPVFFIFPLFLVPDFLSLLSEPGGVSSNVAVSAHIGGTFAGMIMALVYIFFGSKSASHRVFGYHDRLNELT
jgi:membrane associated rhomboid family serine protease